MLINWNSRLKLLSASALVTAGGKRKGLAYKTLPLTVLFAGTALWHAPPVLAADSGGVEEIVVTAQKRAQRLQDVGIAVTALGGDKLATLAHQNFAAIANLAPSVQVQEFTPAVTILNIRGVATADFNYHQESPIAFYNDEVYISSTGAIEGQLFDVKQEEILRGPQGTLFGRNATGGLVQMTTQKPTSDFEAGVGLTAGSYGQISSDAFVSGPLSDRVRGRLAFSSNKNDGYMHNDLLGKDSMSERFYAVRGIIDADVGSDGKLLVKLEGFRNDHQSTNGTTVSPSAPNTQGLGVLTGPVPDPFANDGEFIGVLDRTYYAATIRYDQDLHWGTLTSLTNFQKLNFKYSEDYDATADQNLEAANTAAELYQGSQEFRLAGKTDRLNWIVGVYGLNIHIHVPEYTFFFGSTLFGIPPSNTPFSQDTKSVAVFGQIEYKFTPVFTGIVGLRWNSDWKKFYLHYDGLDQFFAPLVMDINPTTAPGVADRQFANYSGKVELDAHLDRDTLLYVSLNRGTKSGGFSIPVLFPLDGSFAPDVSRLVFNQEELINYEGGFKLSFLDSKVTFNGSAFHYDYRNYQGFTYVNGAVLVVNMPANITGYELEVTARPIPELQVSAFASNLLQAVAHHVNINGLVTDTRMLQTPKWSLGASLAYTQTLGNVGSLQFATDWKYNTGQYEDTFNAPANYDPQRIVGNLRLTFTPPSGRWDAAFFVNNVTDKHYRIYGVDDSSIGFEQSNFAPPRWFGGTFTYRFGK